MLLIFGKMIVLVAKQVWRLAVSTSVVVASFLSILAYIGLLDIVFRKLRGLEIAPNSGFGLVLYAIYFCASAVLFSSKAMTKTCSEGVPHPAGVALSRSMLLLLFLTLTGISSGLAVKNLDREYTEISAAVVMGAVAFLVADTLVVCRLLPPRSRLKGLIAHAVRFVAKLWLLTALLVLAALFLR